MRRLLPFAGLLIAGCAATTSPPTPAPRPVAAPSLPSDLHDHRTVNGMTASELIQHFGKPRLQVVEGEGTKLQFAGPNCLLDIYLYPPAGGSGAPRTTHIDARNLQGMDVSAQSCAAAIEAR